MKPRRLGYPLLPQCHLFLSPYLRLHGKSFWSSDGGGESSVLVPTRSVVAALQGRPERCWRRELLSVTRTSDSIVGPPYLQVLHLRIQPVGDQKYIIVIIFFLFLERGREREREGETHGWGAFRTGPDLGPSLPRRCVPRLGIELLTFQFAGQRTQLSHTGWNPKYIFLNGTLSLMCTVC